MLPKSHQLGIEITFLSAAVNSYFLFLFVFNMILGFFDDSSMEMLAPSSGYDASSFRGCFSEL
jgi:hypothetical protein